MVWDIDPVIFKLGFVELRYYSLMFIIGIVFGTFYIKKKFVANGLSEKIADSLQSHIIVGMIIGARLGHCLFYDPGYYLAHPFEIIQVWKGGLASHGGFIGVLIAMYIFSRKYRSKSYLWFVESTLAPVALTAGLIRLGNLFNSEMIGKKTNVAWAFIFKRIDSFPRHPAQLYEALTYISIAIFLHFIWSSKIENKKWVAGKGLGLTFILICTGRFIMEFFKINQAGFEQSMTFNMGQLLSIPFILIGFYLMTGHINSISKLNFLTKAQVKKLDSNKKSKKKSKK